MVALGAAAGRLALTALGASLRIRVAGEENLHGLRRNGTPFLFVVWHGRMLLPIYRHRGEGIIGMVSLSKDGDLTARLLEGLGYATVRGSSSRGGREAYHGLVDGLAAPGAAGAVIPDGPRGPARVLKPGVVRIASEAHAAILPLSSSARPARRLRSWDRFVLPWPLARAVIVYGAPVLPPAGLDDAGVERVRAEVEATLGALDTEADRLLGVAAPASIPGTANPEPRATAHGRTS